MSCAAVCSVLRRFEAELLAVSRATATPALGLLTLAPVLGLLITDGVRSLFFLPGFF